MSSESLKRLLDARKKYELARDIFNVAKFAHAEAHAKAHHELEAAREQLEAARKQLMAAQLELENATSAREFEFLEIQRLQKLEIYNFGSAALQESKISVRVDVPANSECKVLVNVSGLPFSAGTLQEKKAALRKLAEHEPVNSAKPVVKSKNPDLAAVLRAAMEARAPKVSSDDSDSDGDW